MIRSLYSGVSGLKNHQLRMDVVGNNIANVNTVGYKAGTTNFQDALSQTIRSGGDGKNPAQIGTGMSVGSIYNDFTEGATQNTGRTLDLAINGNGFFVVKDTETDTEYYTRAGAFFLDNEGYLVNSDGLRVQSAEGDIRVFNGPASTIEISPAGVITGTNKEGEQLQFSSTLISIPAPTEVTEAKLEGASIGALQPIVSANGSLSGDAIEPATPPVEAKVEGNSNSAMVEPQLATAESVDMSSEVFQLKYDDGDTEYTVDLHTNLTDVQGWYDLANQLQAAIDDPSNPAEVVGNVKVYYDDSAYGGLVFETITDPDAKNTGGSDPITPKITLSGAGVAKYMGDLSAAQLTDPGQAVVPEDWTGKTFNFYVEGYGWQEVTLKTDYTEFEHNFNNTGFDEVTSGQDLADKLQQLLNVMAGDDPTTGPLEGEAIVSVIWDNDNDRLVFEPNPADPSKKITLGGPDIADFIGTGSAATESNIDWTSKDITINYNGTSYSFSLSEKQAAGLDSITSGSALADALNKLIDDKIGSDKVDVTWSTDHLVFQTKDTTGIGIKPSITIGGADAADFVGSTTSANGIASTQPEIPGQEPDNVIRLVTFSNPEGLLKVGTNIYESSASTSGLPENDTVSTIKSGYTEMSNVDLTDEFANLITTQRGYQANARTITTSDSMLDELLNLKR